jgi:hypothetical protein
VEQGVSRNVMFAVIGATMTVALVAISALWSLDYALAFLWSTGIGAS